MRTSGINLILAWSLIAVTPAEAVSQSDTWFWQLAELEAVRVSVGISSDDALPGIAEPRLETLVELRLRSHGLSVVSWGEPGAAMAPELAVSIVALPSHVGRITVGYTFATQVALNETVVLPRNDFLILADGWKSLSVYNAPTANLRNDIERSVSEKVDEFLNAWLAANR